MEWHVVRFLACDFSCFKFCLLFSKIHTQSQEEISHVSRQVCILKCLTAADHFVSDPLLSSSPAAQVASKSLIKVLLPPLPPWVFERPHTFHAPDGFACCLRQNVPCLCMVRTPDASVTFFLSTCDTPSCGFWPGIFQEGKRESFCVA